MKPRFFHRDEYFPSLLERAVFVRLKIGKADNDLFWIEGCRDLRNAVRKIVHIKTLLIAPPVHPLVYFLLERFVEAFVVDERQWVYADGGSDDELFAREPDALVRQKRFLERRVGGRKVH